MVTPDYPTGKLPPQSLLQHRYLIVGLVGQGGMGAVYQALDTQTAQRRVAVKEMSQAHLSEAERAAAGTRFQAEAALLATLTHPSLPRVYEAFSEQGKLYLVMDFIQGKTLYQLLHEHKGQPLPVGQVLSFAMQLCDVLVYLHQHVPPIIFRDLKPANVMVTERGKVFLIDFGIARLFKAGQEQDTFFLGSPGYASPEQYGIFQTSPRSDLYSLGATLHHCLTGRDPSYANNSFSFLPVLHSNSQVPEELDQLIQRMVALDVQQRPTSALEVQRALVQISQQGVAPTEQLPPLSSIPAYGAAAPLRGSPAPQPAIERGNAPAAFGQVRPPQSPRSTPPASSQSFWAPAFSLPFWALLALTVGGSTYAFNFIVGSDHLVEFSLCVLLLLVLLGTTAATRTLTAWVVLGLSIPALAIAGFAFLVQSAHIPASAALPAWMVVLLQMQTLNLLITSGLTGSVLVPLLWLARPFPWQARLALGGVFGLPLACMLLQYPSGDDVVSKHVLLLVGLIALIEGAVLASRMERMLQQRKGA